MRSDEPVSELKRLHPASLLFSFVGLVRAFIIPGLVILFAGRGRGPELLIMILAIPALAAAVAKYLSLRYQLTETDLVVREGILKRNERHIPFERIQNIDTTRNVLHRLLGVADVKVQTASGTKPEATLQVLSLDAIDTMRDHVFSRRRAAASKSTEGEDRWRETEHPETTQEVSTPVPSGFQESPRMASASPARRPEGRVIGHLSTRELLLLGIISNRGMVALAAVMGLLAQADIMPSEERIEGIATSIPGIGGWSPLHAVALGVAALVAAVVLLRLLSMAWALLALYDFTLRRDQDELRSHFGLLTQRTATIPRHRIQLVQIEAGLLHRAFGRVVVRARTAGSGTGEQSGLSQDWLMPLLPTADLRALLVETHTDLDPDALSWQSLPARAIRRLRNRQLILLLPLAAAALIPGLKWAIPIWLLLALVAWRLPRMIHRHMRWALTGSALWYRSGWLVRTTRVVRFSKIQAVGLLESPFDRRRQMRTLAIDTANAGIGRHAIAIPFLEADTADLLAERLTEEAGATAFRW